MSMNHSLTSGIGGLLCSDRSGVRRRWQSAIACDRDAGGISSPRRQGERRDGAALTQGDLDMRYGFYLPTRGGTAAAEEIEAIVARGDELGFSSVMIADHIVFPTTIA